MTEHRITRAMGEESLMIRAFHFVGSTLRDGSIIPPDGEWLIHTGAVKICERGLHASRHPWDAVQYAPGATLCLVDCDGIITEQDDKLVCTKRRIVARFDATDLLWEQSRWCALQVIHLWDAPQVVRDYLTTGDESLRAAAMAAARAAARDAAMAAARAAARDAAMAAARDAAGAAAMAAARDAAMAAAMAAAGDAAMAAAMAAAGDAQKNHWAELVAAKFAAMGVTP